MKAPAKRGRKVEGIRYERKVQAHLGEQSEYYLASPWIIFIVDGRPHWCQPDGLHFDVNRGVLTVVEVKYSHTAEAHRQLRCVYAPVLARIFPASLWTIRLVEIVKWFDPDVKFPEQITMCPDPLKHASASIGVHIWRP
jgi:hypothetical protein